ncbi:hypothetical protein OUK_0780 [Helicobacter pylori R037c]|nr:hypothetical protein OUK_0780 [Helicobacter pylori R037c]
MKSILLFMIFVVCQLEGKKFSQDNFKVDYNYYLRKTIYPILGISLHKKPPKNILGWILLKNI